MVTIFATTYNKFKWHTIIALNVRFNEMAQLSTVGCRQVWLNCW